MLRKDGYHIIEKRIKIEPSNDDFIVKEQLKAKPRQLVFDIKGGDDMKKISDPGTVTFDRNQVKENADIPPKKQGYEVRIKKDGFGLWKQNLIVEPSDKPFILNAVLNVLKRRILLTVEASYPHGHNLMPVDKCLLGDTVVTADTEVKPNDYQLIVNKAAYKPVSRVEKIPPGEVPHRIHVIMDPAPRTVDLDIQYDVQPENSKIEQIVRVAGGSVDKNIKDGDSIIPNKYNLQIIAEGYEKLEEKIDVPPAEGTYPLKRMLKASPRNVILRVTTDYPPGQLITPDKVLLNGKPFGDDDKGFTNKIKPGKYSLMIDKAGYHSIKKEIFVPAGTADYIIQEQMITASRIVKYKIYNSETKQELIPDKISLGTQPVTQDSPFKPGKYRLYVRTPGYPDIVEDGHEIVPGVGPHLIERGLLAAKSRNPVRDHQ